MKIGIDARLYGLKHAGIGRYVMHLVEELKRLDTTNQYILFLRQDVYHQLNLPPNWHKVLADVHHYTLAEQIYLPKLIKSSQVDLIHFPHFNVPLLYPGPFIVTIHDLLWHEVRGLRVTTLNPLIYLLKYGGYRLVVAHALTKAAHILVPSHWVRQELEVRFNLPSHKVSVTYEGIATAFSQPVNSQTAVNLLSHFKITPPFVVYTGSTYPHKNLRVLLQAISQLKQQKVNLKLVIVSARSVFLNELKAFVHRLKLDSQVIFTGFIADSELRLLYSQAAALVHPSLSEGFGLIGLEAMAAGLSVVASQAGSLPEIYQDAALYFDPQSVADLTAKLQAVLTDQTLVKNLQAKGRQLAQTYSWTTTAQKTLQVYQKFL